MMDSKLYVYNILYKLTFTEIDSVTVWEDVQSNMDRSTRHALIETEHHTL